MRNGTISETKKKKLGDNVEINGCGCMIFGVIASVNLCLCTPLYLMVIAYLWAKVMGE